MPASPRKPKVVVAMSGGVDSSVTAALLQQRGYEVVGCFMRLGSEDEAEVADGYDNLACKPTPAKAHKQGCCSVNDASDARLVAAMLDIPFYVLNFKRDFGRIIDYFVDEYHAGRTPNPCVRCNDWLKFGKLHDYARSIDADFIASGHYARIARDAEPSRGLSEAKPRIRLLRGVDHDKDQSYVLFGTPRDRLARMLLPVGEMRKREVRRLAEDLGLPVFDKPDSQEICFVPDNDYARLVRRRDPDRVRPGAVVDTAGRAVGAHPGQQHFTVGQRRGLGLALGYPVYVVEKNAATNTVTVGSSDELLATGCTADQTNWLVDPPSPGAWDACRVKTRYGGEPEPAEVRVTGKDALEVRFAEPTRAVTPGQAVVCYDADRGEQVLGGGWVRDVRRATGS